MPFVASKRMFFPEMRSKGSQRIAGIVPTAAGCSLAKLFQRVTVMRVPCKENISMASIARFPEVRFHPFGRRQQTLAAILSLLLLTAHSGLAQSVAKKPVKPAAKKEPEIKEELTLKNGDRLTGQLLNSTGTEIKFKSDLAGEVTVALNNVKEVKSKRKFAIVPKDAKNARNSAMVPQGAIRIGEKGVVVFPTSTTTPELSAVPSRAEGKAATPTTEVVAAKEVPASKIAVIVDDTSYQKQIDRKIGFRSGWDGDITTGTTVIFSTQGSQQYQASTSLKRSVPSVSWLDPKLRTIIDFTLSAGKTTQPGTTPSITNIFHVGTERDEYFSPRGYYLQMVSFDHNYSQGLVIQQKYGGGIGRTLIKKKNAELDVTTDLHYENQQFKANAAADVQELNLHLIASSLTEAYTRKWGKIHFDEKFLADIPWNDVSAFSAAGTGSVRLPVYKNLGFSVSTVDNFLNNPQVGYKRNSFQVSTGVTLSLH
jgi:hypothetical protein